MTYGLSMQLDMKINFNKEPGQWQKIFQNNKF